MTSPSPDSLFLRFQAAVSGALPASDLGAYADATEAVERSLRPPRHLIPRTSLP